MPLDYSKWDALELSDDEDFECQYDRLTSPNVDKKSMVRWKQAQIHKERRERQDQRDLLKLEYEATIKFIDFLPIEIKKINDLSMQDVVPFLEGLSKRVDTEFTDPMRQESMSKMKNWPGNWEPPVWGEVLRSHTPWHEEINRIAKESFEALQKDNAIDLKSQIHKEVEASIKKFKDRQPVIQKELKRLEDLMNKKLTMDHMHTGFDKTFVAKETDQKSVAPAADKTSKKQVEEVIFTPSAQKSFFDAETEHQILAEMESTDEEMLEKHPKLLEFSKTSDYGALAKLLRQNPTLMTEKMEEALLLRGLCLEIMAKPKEAKNCVMVSLIIKFTRSLGVNGIDVFFQKLTGTGASAQNLFFSDLKTTYDHIQSRGLVLRKEQVEKAQKLKEQREARQKIFESFKQPDGTLKLPVGDEPTEMELKQKEWFDVLPEAYKEGLLTEDIDKINEYLGSLEPEEAEYQAQMAVKAGFIQMQEEDE